MFIFNFTLKHKIHGFQCTDLLKKKRIVEDDKLKLADVIVGLEDKKRRALEEAWRKVNKDFGSIFSTLLPNSQAKLEPPQGQTVLDGLEVRVAFGNVWKESLAELSGGQRWGHLAFFGVDVSFLCYCVVDVLFLVFYVPKLYNLPFCVSKQMLSIVLYKFNELF